MVSLAASLVVGGLVLAVGVRSIKLVLKLVDREFKKAEKRLDIDEYDDK